MFGFLSGKSKKDKSYSQTSLQLLSEISQSHCWLNEHIETNQKIPRINWQSVYTYLDKQSESFNQDLSDQKLTLLWLDHLKHQLPDGYHIYESKHFVVLSRANDKYLQKLFKMVEAIYDRVQLTLKGMILDELDYKHPILIFENLDLYYDYISYFYPEDGEFQQSSGVFLSYGICHFVVPEDEMSQLEAVISHELTHALVAHLPIPAWLNEGLAVNVESMITRYSSYRLNEQKDSRHRAFWNEDTIQLFWSGKGFHQPGETSELCYHLAQIMVRSLAEDHEGLTRFVNSANISDAGENAAKEIYGGSLGAIIEHFFGSGNWSPNPQLWQLDNSNA